ncbi:hypothetical protein PC123_g20788 [Phytophthora cactorum]|nr:hypothetical protein PC123_g20788 [Phytophthora cactorum]
MRGYYHLFQVLIDYGASKYFARRQTVARNRDKLTDAQRESKIISDKLVSVRLANGTVIEVPKVNIDLSVKFEDFDSTELFIVLDVNKYDMILGMPWLEKHEPWSHWRCKAIGASRPALSDRALVSHVPASGRSVVTHEGHQGVGAPQEFICIVNVLDTNQAIVAPDHATGRRPLPNMSEARGPFIAAGTDRAEHPGNCSVVTADSADGGWGGGDRRCPGSGGLRRRSCR